MQRLQRRVLRPGLERGLKSRKSGSEARMGVKRGLDEWKSTLSDVREARRGGVRVL